MKYDELSEQGALDVPLRYIGKLGPGLLESTYEQCLGLRTESTQYSRSSFKSNCRFNIKQIKLDCGYRIDLLVDDRIVVELEERRSAYCKIHEAQVLTYMKLAEQSGLADQF